MRKLAVAVACAVAVSAVSAADPPALVNYQGVLRDALDKPRAGTFDMVFRFYDALSAGSEILVDSHTGGGGNAVTVAGGLFNAQLGGGTLSDGSGAGTYTSLSQVFRDYGTVYLQITVGGETLSPRIRIQSAAYALNATNLQGKPASNFLDTTSSSQTKAGHLVASGGLEGNNASGVGVQGIGGQAGGTFADQALTAIANLGYSYNGNTEHYGVFGQGPTAGGWFRDGDGSGNAYVGYGEFGIQASGNWGGGYFSDNAGSGAGVAVNGFGLDASGATGVRASGANTGVIGSGSTTGGVFFGGGNTTYLATSWYGVDATGSFTGGWFKNDTGDGEASVGNGNYGIYAYGSYTGGYFQDTNNTGSAYLALSDLGIDASGAQAGGHFTKPATNAQAYLAASNGFTENGVYGLSNGPSESPGYFLDQYYGSYAYVGQGGYKIWGSGSVSFVQNDPSDASRVIVYTAPEGDETAVYTRGTARLAGGTARVRLGETFARVANPDIGLTVQLTPHGAAVPLAVDSVTTSELVVHGPADGPPDVAFDYAVWGLRIGFEDRPVVRPKLEEAFIPSTAPDDALYAAHPELETFSARERFARMESAVDPERSAARSAAASDALKAAVHVYDREADRPAIVAAAPEAARAPAPEPPEDSDAVEEPTEPVFPPNTSPVTVVGTVRAGEVVTVTEDPAGSVAIASTPFDRGVVGIIGGPLGSAWSGEAPLVVSGITICSVDASFSPIAVGDLLVASQTPGHAMRAQEYPPPGTVVAKALEPLPAGTGAIRVLVLGR